MGRIRVLPKLLANQIAAGEVVERPCSVVKELMENAIDSGCSEILCEIKSAGKTLIRVRDNGCGIHRDDLPLALCPHATSKIYCADDLNGIMTLGFRGEALASIASVSRLSLISKSEDADSAYSLEVEGEEQHPVIAPAAHPNGTTVDVSDLFFNTPARRRFLKSDRTEFLRIKDTFVRTALSHQNIGFELIADSKRVIKVGASKGEGLDIKRTRTLMGADFSVNGISVICEDPRLQINGMILPPPLEEQALSEQIYLFLNGRPIADKVVTHALKEGVFEVVQKTLPIRAVLYLKLDPKEVDVNVHPRKDEVRFHEVSAVHDLICQSIVDALKRAGVRAQTYLKDDAALQSDAGEEVQSEDLFASIDPLHQAENYPHQHAHAPVSSAISSGFSEDRTKTRTDSFSHFSHFNAPSSHESTYNIDDASLPSFPENVSGIIDISSVEDRSSPQIVKKEVPSYQAVYQSLLSDPDKVGRSIGLYKARVDAANSVSKSLESIAQSSCFNVPVYENMIECIDVIMPNCAFVRYEGQYYFVNLKRLSTGLYKRSYVYAQASGNIHRRALKLPFALKRPYEQIRELKECAHILSRLGFDFNFKKTVAELVSMPEFIKGSDLAGLLSSLFDCVLANRQSLDEGECPECIASLIADSCKESYETNNARVLLSSVKDFEELEKLGAVKPVDLKALATDIGV